MPHYVYTQNTIGLFFSYVHHFIPASGNKTCIISSKRVKARWVLLLVSHGASSSTESTYFNRELLIVPSTFLAAICAFWRPTTLLAKSGIRVFSTAAASFLLFPLSCEVLSTPCFIRPFGHIESLTVSMYFDMLFSDRRLSKDSRTLRSMVPPRSWCRTTIQLEGLEEEVRDWLHKGW
jgi:hypothetical protein